MQSIREKQGDMKTEKEYKYEYEVEYKMFDGEDTKIVMTVLANCEKGANITAAKRIKGFGLPYHYIHMKTKNTDV